MAKAPVRKLKVFQAQFGFYDTVLAAPSQAAALRAWGTHQDLFANGEATAAMDEGAIKSALAHPAVLLRRAVGSGDTFELVPTSLPNAPDALKRPTSAKPKAAHPAKPHPPADRSKLDAAEAALRQVEKRRKAEEAELRCEEEALEAKQLDAQTAYVEARKAARAAVEAARQAYRNAGGAT
jgi:hypothetical protein